MRFYATTAGMDTKKHFQLLLTIFKIIKPNFKGAFFEKRLFLCIKFLIKNNHFEKIKHFTADLQGNYGAIPAKLSN